MITSIDPALRERVTKATQIFEQTMPGYNLVVLILGRDGAGGIATTLDDETTLLALDESTAYLRTHTGGR